MNIVEYYDGITEKDETKKQWGMDSFYYPFCY